MTQPNVGMNEASTLQPPLSLLIEHKRVLRYDNESDNGDHKHACGKETSYAFVSVDRLLDDFLVDVAAWKGQ